MCGERDTYFADRNINCCKSNLGCAEFYMSIFWPVIQEDLVPKKICMRVFWGVLSVLAVCPLCLQGLTPDKGLSCLLTSFSSWLTCLPWPLTKHRNPSSRLPSLKFLAFCCLGHSIPCDMLLFHLLMCFVSVTLECKFHKSKNLVCFVHLSI